MFLFFPFFTEFISKKPAKKKSPSLGGLEPPTFRLTAERANRLRHRDSTFEGHVKNKDPHDRLNQVLGVITG